MWSITHPLWGRGDGLGHGLRCGCFLGSSRGDLKSKPIIINCKMCFDSKEVDDPLRWKVFFAQGRLMYCNSRIEIVEHVICVLRRKDQKDKKIKQALLIAFYLDVGCNVIILIYYPILQHQTSSLIPPQQAQAL